MTEKRQMETKVNDDYAEQVPRLTKEKSLSTINIKLQSKDLRQAVCLTRVNNKVSELKDTASKMIHDND